MKTLELRHWKVWREDPGAIHYSTQHFSGPEGFTCNTCQASQGYLHNQLMVEYMYVVHQGQP